MEEISKDPNYKLIVILMDDMDVLKQETMTPYMKAFLHNRTYLEANDPKLWGKLENILKQYKTVEDKLETCQTIAL